MDVDMIAKQKWHFFHKRYRSCFFQVFLTGYGLRFPWIPYDSRVRYFGHFFDHVIIPESEKKRLHDLTVAHLEKEPEFLIKLMQRAYDLHREYVLSWQKQQGKDYSSASNSELAKELNTYIQQLLNFGFTIGLPLFVEDYLEEFVQQAFKKIIGKNAALCFQLVSNPVKDGIVLQEEIELLKIALHPSQKALEGHREQFAWMANVGYLEQYHPLSYYQDRLAKMQNPKKRLQELQEERSRHNKDFAELLKKIAKDNYLITIVKTLNEAVYFRSYRTEVYYSSARYFTALFKEVAKRLSIDNYKDVVWLYWTEIDGLLRNNKHADKNLIATRKKGYVFLTDFDGRFWHFDGKEACEYFKAFQRSQEKSLQAGNEVKGKPAYEGKVRGRCVVVHTLDDLKKVKQGDILVTHATNINFVTTLKKVSAIVTEEGGVLSHAAIISREMRIPCVIGTQIATTIFKDGDMVEVDGENGIVKKL